MSDEASTARVERDLRRHAVEGTATGVVDSVPPRAALAVQETWVMFSYAWLDDGKVGKQLHAIQGQFFDELQRQLKYPPVQFANLPPLRLWRDERRLHYSEPADRQIDAICRDAFLCVLMISDKYPYSAVCMAEAECFLDEKGGNREGKHCIVVPVNVERSAVPPRFSNKLRLWVLDDEGRPLNKGWSKSAAKREALVRKVSSEIFRAAAESLLRSAAQEPSRHPVAALASFACFEHQVDQTVGPRARRARIGAEIGVPQASSTESEGLDIVTHLADWACTSEGPRLTAVLGEFGMGKTVTCQLLTQELLKRHERGVPGAPLPLYFDLRNVLEIQDRNEPNLETLIDQMLRRSGEKLPPAAEVIAYVRHHSALVIFDGLDEVTNKLSPAQAISMYRELLAIVPAQTWQADAMRRREVLLGRAPEAEPNGGQRGPRIVVSCRSHYFRDISDQRSFLTGTDRAGLSPESDIQIFVMLPFSPEQVTDYLRLHLPEAEAMRANELIRETYDLGQLAQRPILLRFIREVATQLEAEKIAGRPINTARLYDILVDQTLARDDKKHVIPRLEKIALLQQLAHAMHQGDLPEFTHTALDAWFVKAAEGLPRLAHILHSVEGLKLSEVFLQDIRNASLLVRVGDGAFRFAHTSIREYFLADWLFYAVCAGDRTALDTRDLSFETEGFIRHRLGVCPADKREAFNTHFPLFLVEGSPRNARWIAISLWARSAFSLPRPTLMDLSEFKFIEEDLDFSDRASWAFENGKRLEDIPKLFPFQSTIWRNTRLHCTIAECIDFRHADLGGTWAAVTEWADCDVQGARFAGADLRGSIWFRCSLSDELFEGANIRDAEIIACGPTVRKLTQEVPLRTERTVPVLRRAAADAVDARLVAVADREILFTVSENFEIRATDAASGRTFAVIQSRTGETSSSPCRIDNSVVRIEVLEEDHVAIRDPKGVSLATLNPRSTVCPTSLTFTSENQELSFELNNDGTLLPRDRSGVAVDQFGGDTKGIASVALDQFDGDRALIVTRKYGGTYFLDPRSGEERGRFPTRSAGVRAFHADGVNIVGATYNSALLYDLRTGELSQHLTADRYMQPGTSVEYLRGAVIGRANAREIVTIWTSSGKVRTIDRINGQVIATARVDADDVWRDMVGGQENERLVLASPVGVTDALTGERIYTRPLATRNMSVAIGQFNGAGAVAYADNLTGELNVVSIGLGKLIERSSKADTPPIGSPISAICLSALGFPQGIVFGHMDGTISIRSGTGVSIECVLSLRRSSIGKVVTGRIGARNLIFARGDDHIVTAVDIDRGGRHEFTTLLGGVKDFWLVQPGGNPVLALSAAGCMELVTLDADTLVAGRRLILGPGKNTLLELQPDGSGGFRLAQASEDAPRYWRAQGFVNDEVIVQSLETMPRVG